MIRVCAPASHRSAPVVFQMDISAVAKTWRPADAIIAADESAGGVGDAGASKSLQRMDDKYNARREREVGWANQTRYAGFSAARRRKYAAMFRAASR